MKTFIRIYMRIYISHFNLDSVDQQVSVLLDHETPPPAEGSPPEPHRAVDSSTARQKVCTKREERLGGQVLRQRQEPAIGERLMGLGLGLGF